ncbi:hypothetical protein ZOSMA_25G00190 [Zostera marina]|uniref:DUF7795 domain-containing protein n=1 Tax=Zostera marina TaxID=29655 RepID=A0A0K9PFA3_ZOSMR|nr:hypothetical protein ZOSMA_25G00190 [Zostera marina]
MMDFSNRISQSFRDLMTLVTKFDELTDIGSRLLKGFRQELDIFNKPTLDNISKIVDGIVKANCTERMVAYVEAGFRHAHLGRQNINKLNSYQERLLDHIKEVKKTINQLESFAEHAISMVEVEGESTYNYIGNRTWNIGELPEFSIEKDDAKVIKNPRENSSFERNFDYAIMMGTIYNMLSLDFAMQEKIVLSLNMDSSSGELESYCLLWDLRPFVDDNIMQQCWTFV